MEDKNDEEYKQFLNYELIKVSKDGKVKYNGEILPQTEKNGYCVVEIPILKNQPEYVHRLVALTWLYDKYEKGKRLQVHHIDCNKSNNHVDNLEWITKCDHKKINHEKFVDLSDYVQSL